MIALLALLLVQEPAKEPVKPETVSKGGAWSVAIRPKSELSWTDNVFNLDGGDKDRRDEERASDAASGRFADMESNEDFLVAGSVRLQAKGPSPFGRRLELEAEAGYVHYVQNPARSHAILGTKAVQPAGAGRLSLSLEFAPLTFNKNYLADATDLTGNVSSSERIYEPGNYREFAVELEYRHPLWTGEAEFDGVAGLWLRDRTYESPFRGRNEDGLGLRLGVVAEVRKTVEAGLRYKLEAVACPTEDEVQVLDETLLGAVLNGDGDAIDTDARAVEAVDRSRLEHSLKLGVVVRAIEPIEIEIAVERTWKEYSSAEAFDVDHRNRSDVKDEITFDVKVALGRGWDARVGYEWSGQATDRPADPESTGETSDYRRQTVWIAVSAKW